MSGNSGSSSSPSGIFPRNPRRSRTATIAAHVDHGKTTLADNLMEHNGLVSERLAGTLRYLDSDPEEQRRGITMRASAVAVQHYYNPPPGMKKKKKKKKVDDKAQKQQLQEDDENDDDGRPQKYIIHLVDSPGHADFRNEVSKFFNVLFLIVFNAEDAPPSPSKRRSTSRSSLRVRLRNTHSAFSLSRACCKNAQPRL